MTPKRTLGMKPHYTGGNDADLKAEHAPDLSTRFGAGRASADGGAVQYTRPSPVTFPPRLFPPPGSVSFYRQASALVAGPASWVTPAGIVLAIPAAVRGVIRFFNVFINNMLATSDILFALRVNQGAVAGFDAITLFPRAAAFVGESFGGAGEVVIDLEHGSVVDVGITVRDVGAYTVGASYAGWYYPEKLAETYARTGGYGF